MENNSRMENNSSEQDIEKTDLKKAAIGVLISLATIVVIFKLTNVNLSLKTLQNMDYKYLAIAFLLQVTFWFLWAVRLKVIVAALEKHISLPYSFDVTMSSMFAAAITPSSAGGEPVRIKFISKQCGGYGVASAVVLIERLLDAVFFAVALPIFVIITDFSVGFGFKVGGIFTVFLFGFLVILYMLFKDPERLNEFIIWFGDKILKRFTKRHEQITEKLLNEAKSFREALIDLIKGKKMYTFAMIVLTVTMWLLGFLIPSFILLAMHSNPVWLLSIASQLLIVVISLIPLTPGSSGIVEGSMAYLYSNFVPSNILGVLVTIWRIITYYTNLIFGFIFSLKIMKSKSAT